MKKVFEILFSSRLFFYTLLVINFFGTLYGFWWYRGQFAETPLYFWPFVPNSPLSVLYFFVVLLLLMRGRRSPFWEGLAYFGLIKHGLWTVAIITLYQLGGRNHPENILLWAGHLGMALQAVLFWAHYGLQLSLPLVGGIAGWYLFNDYLDYSVGIHPYVDTSAINLATVRGLALAYTAALTLAYLYNAIQNHKRKNVP